MDSISKLGYLFVLEAYQNESSLLDYFPFVSGWSLEFIKYMKESEPETYKKVTESWIFEGEEDIDELLEEVVLNQPSPNGEPDLTLLMCWARWISKNPKAYLRIGQELNEFFSPDADIYYWLDSGGPKTVKEAVQWCKELWPSLNWEGAPEDINAW